jgi:hypothetical protein
MDRLPTTPLLRLSLMIDAVASGATGLLMAALPGPLGAFFGLPPGLVQGVGLFFLPYAAGVAYLGTRPAPARRGVQLVILLNLIWVVDSVLFAAFAGPLLGLAPSALGIAFVLAQAALVLGFALLQAIALRRAEAGPVAAPRAA